MKYLKTFENLLEPQIGDYVKCDPPGFEDEFFKKNIGRLIKIDIEHHGSEMKFYQIKFDVKVPEDIMKSFGSALGDNTLSLNDYEVSNFAKTKEDLETKLNANKYNL